METPLKDTRAGTLRRLRPEARRACSLVAPLVQRVGAAAHLAHRHPPHLLREKGEQLLQVAAPVTGGGTYDPAHDPGERAHEGSLTEVMLRRMLRSEHGQRLGKARTFQGFVGKQFRRRGLRGLLHSY